MDGDIITLNLVTDFEKLELTLNEARGIIPETRSKFLTKFTDLTSEFGMAIEQ